MARQKTKKINLALQGGGAHGAFTWGVLDYLLEDKRIDISAISGTSIGAINACILADGFCNNDREEARERLERGLRMSLTRSTSIHCSIYLKAKLILKRWQHVQGFRFLSVPPM